MFNVGDIVRVSDKINGEDIALDSIIDEIEIFKEIYELIKANPKITTKELKSIW